MWRWALAGDAQRHAPARTAETIADLRRERFIYNSEETRAAKRLKFLIY
jgi:hypothetical protein